jgi:glycerophosphoryl diester phosphodiesterase
MTAAAPLVIAHRGYSARCPENTLAAFEAAAAAGCDMIELDVTLTRDRRVVVIHDDTLDRTTNGRGRVAERTLAEIAALDAGSWFGPAFAGERVPELAAVLARVAGRCRINVEIKASAFEADAPPDAIERQVAALAGRHPGRVLVSSFEPRFLERLAASPDAPPLALISRFALNAEVLEFLARIRAYSWHPFVGVLDGGQVARAHAAGLKVFPWTITRRAEAERAAAAGADGLIANEIELVRNLPAPGPAAR